MSLISKSARVLANHSPDRENLRESLIHLNLPTACATALLPLASNAFFVFNSSSPIFRLVS
jgi:hypothetical protein